MVCTSVVFPPVVRKLMRLMTVSLLQSVSVVRWLCRSVVVPPVVRELMRVMTVSLLQSVSGKGGSIGSSRRGDGSCGR
jgi:hypothetical protein